MGGKEKCKILKQIRQQIADENEIPYVTSQCKHQGDCAGTCPKCEAELRELEKQLAKRQAMGKRITVAALCAGIAFASIGCSPSKTEPEWDELDGDVAMPETSCTVEQPEILEGEVAQ